MMYAANVEAWLVPALAALLRGKSEIAFSILQPIDNLSTKIGIIFNVAEQRRGRPLPDAILDRKEVTLAAIGYRNRLAHGQFGFDIKSNEISLVSGILNGGRRGKPGNNPLDCVTIRAHSQALKDIISVIRNHCGQNMWFGIPNPQRPASRDKRAKANPAAK